MSIILENDRVRATFNLLGAELTSFMLKEHSLEYIWQGNPDFWGRHAPVLFPFVGRLKNDKYTYNSKHYEMGQHGFARDALFTVEYQTENKVSFLLKSSPETIHVYPFEFELRLIYTLQGLTLTTTYEVTSLSEDMYFSIGGHPAFNVPLTEGSRFEDYYVRFYPSKSRSRLPLSGPYVDTNCRTLAQTNTAIQVSRSWFKDDAVILETSGKNAFSILSEKHPHGVTLSYDDFPYVGFWTHYEKESPFLCIEPWCGVADTLDTTSKLVDKLGINHLKKNEQFIRSYKIDIH